VPGGGFRSWPANPGPSAKRAVRPERSVPAWAKDLHVRVPELLHGSYQPPALHRGDRTTCLYRDTEVTITSWTDAPIPWPRCRVIGAPGRGSLSARSAWSRRWPSVTGSGWRQAFGVTQWGSEGSRRLHQAVSESAAAKAPTRPLGASCEPGARDHSDSATPPPRESSRGRGRHAGRVCGSILGGARLDVNAESFACFPCLARLL
jgi:hypothetical protein